MEPTDSLGLEWQCFGTVAEVPGTVVAAEVPGTVVVAEVPGTAVAAEESDIAAAAAEGLHTAGLGLDIESGELRTVGLAVVGYMSVVLGKRDSLDERQLQHTIWRADRKLCQRDDLIKLALSQPFTRYSLLQLLWQWGWGW